MSSRSKIVVFLITCGLIACFAAPVSQNHQFGKDLCQRPMKNSFENLKHVNEYIECLKSQVTTRYGKRAYFPSSVLPAKQRPTSTDILYNNDYYLQKQQQFSNDNKNLQSLYDMLKYADNYY